MTALLQKYLGILTQKEQNTWMGLVGLLLVSPVLPLFAFLLVAVSVFAALKFEQDIKAGLALMIGVMPILFGFLPYGWLGILPIVTLCVPVLVCRKFPNLGFYLDVQIILYLVVCIMLLAFSDQNLVEQVAKLFATRLPEGYPVNPAHYLSASFNLAMMSALWGVGFYHLHAQGSWQSFTQTLMDYQLKMVQLVLMVVLMIWLYFLPESYWTGGTSLLQPLMVFLPLALTGALLVISTVKDANISWLTRVTGVVSSFVVVMVINQFYLLLAFVGLIEYFFNVKTILINRKVKK